MKTTRERFEEKFGFVFGDDSEFGKKGEVTLDVSAIPSGKTLKDILAFVESEKAIQREEIKAEILHRNKNLEALAMSTKHGELTRDTVHECFDSLLDFLTPNHNG